MPFKSIRKQLGRTLPENNSNIVRDMEEMDKPLEEPVVDPISLCVNLATGGLSVVPNTIKNVAQSEVFKTLKEKLRPAKYIPNEYKMIAGNEWQAKTGFGLNNNGAGDTLDYKKLLNEKKYMRR